MPPETNQERRERTDRELLLLTEQSVGVMIKDIKTLFDRLEEFRKENDARHIAMTKDTNDQFRSMTLKLGLAAGGLVAVIPFLQWLITKIVQNGA